MALLLPIIVVSSLSACLAMARLGPVVQALADHGGPVVSCAGGRLLTVAARSRPEDLLCLELAFTATNVRQVFDGWKLARGSVVETPGALAGKIALARKSIRLDWWLIASYSVGLTAFGLVLMWLLRYERRTFAPVLLCCPLVAGLLDVAENLSLLELLAQPESPAALPAALGGFASLLKWGLLLVVVPVALLAALLRLPWRARSADQTLETFDDVLAAELEYIGERRKLTEGTRGAAPDARPIGLALSGGGIRSATFNLGVLQQLAGLHALRHVDYVSTVSGGGYIGSCFSSFLSHNAESPLGKTPYRFQGATKPPFGTEPASFPFNPNASEQIDLGDFNGRAQLRHLRTHGDFLIARRSLLSRDLLRAVGHTIGSSLYHLLVALLFLVSMAGFYLAVLQAMVGDLVSHIAPVLSPGLYARALFHAGSLDTLPFLTALLAGTFSSVIGLGLGMLIYGVPARWLDSDGQSVEESQGYLALWIIFWVTMITASFMSWYWIHDQERQLAFLSIPLGVYVAGQLVSLVLHPLVVVPSCLGRNDRSRFASAHGLFAYLNVISLIVLTFPYAIVALFERNPGPKTTATWLLSIIAARFLAPGSKAPASATGVLARIRKLSAPLRNALLSVIVVVLIVGGTIIICVDILQLQPSGAEHLVWFPLVIGLIALALFVLVGVALDFNKLSLHYFYRDRLAETYLQTFVPSSGSKRMEILRRDDSEMALTSLHGEHPSGDGFDGQCVTSAPYHLLTAALNLTASRDMTRRDRKSDYFLFSKLYCGSNTTGYMRTDRYRSGETKLARAMTISGAAASSAIGGQTFLAQSFALTLLGVRLGQWMENPRYRAGRRANRNEGGVFWPFYLLREMIGSTDANRRLVNLSDGGHTGDNVGLCPLLKRRCALVIACDAEADPEFAFGSLTEALRQSYVDDNIRVEIDLDRVRRDSATGCSKRHWAAGTIYYPEIWSHGKRVAAAATGYLVVLKASFVGGTDDSEPVKNYRQAHGEFPHESTVDQFFDDDQFESYRELGMYIARRALEVPDAAWRPESVGWADAWNARVAAGQA